MWHRRWLAAVIFLALTGAAMGATGAGPAAAAARNPELLAKDEAAEGQAPRALRIGRLSVEVDLAGGMARTTVTAKIENPGRNQLEGDFALDLPAGSVVTGYALDVGGAMIPGVLQAQRPARLAFEARERRGVDPGLGEVRANAFRTRVSPVMAGVGRTVRVTFVTPFDVAHPYRLPLNAPEPVEGAQVVVRGGGGGVGVLGAASGAEIGGDLPLAFRAGPDGVWRAELSGAPLAGVLEIRVRPARKVLTLSRHASGETFFDLSDQAPVEAAQTGGRLRIYWDVSRSRGGDDHAAEIALVRRYVAQARPREVVLVTLSDEPAAAVVLPGDADAVAGRLRRLTYRGGTSYQGLADPASAGADVCLLVSDGRPTLDAYRPRDMGCRLYAVSSAEGANGALLGAFAQASGGTRLDLAARGGGEALADLIQGRPAVSAARDGTGKAAAYAGLAAPRGRFRIVGPVPADHQLRLTLADGSERTYALDGAVAAHDGAGAMWGAAQVAALAASDHPDGEAVLALSRRYAVASEQASFLVLDTMADYAQAGVAPPASFGKAALAEYAEAVADKAEQDAQRRRERLDEVIKAWRFEKAWWNTAFDPHAGPRRGKGGRTELVVTAERRMAPPPVMAPMAAPPPAPMAAPRALADAPNATVSEMVVTKGGFASGRAQISVAVEPWDPDRPYLKVLRAAPPERFWAVHDEQARQYGTLPAYYLDVAEMLWRAGRAADARRVVVEAAELPIADASTLTILADRLARYGEPARALWMYEHIAAMEPDRPQPLRNLALALIARADRKGASAAERKADYSRALGLLTKVILTPWRSGYDGIELVSLMEANRIIPKLQALGGKVTLDPRLVAKLDVDLRVVLEWNTDATDMDLWVDEPNGERAIYDNPRTAIGGRLSNDMTSGYGPEEYLLRRAPDGTYEVRVNVFNTDVLNQNGSTTARATLFRNYGRAGESSQSMEVELQGRAGDVLVGKAKVARRP